MNKRRKYLSNLVKLNVEFYDYDVFRIVAGSHDKHINILNHLFDTEIITKGKDVFCDLGDDSLKKLEEVLKLLIKVAQLDNNLEERDVIYISKQIEHSSEEDILKIYKNKFLILTGVNGKPVYAKTQAQIKYMKKLDNYSLVFGIGPAGTGKTYLAVLYAVKKLKEGQVKKIILTRPAVEAGEKLGFLPGDLKEKVDPYLRPLYDALYESLGSKQVDMMIEKGTIEIAPLAYMRGRTLDNAIVILDEAQNTTAKQMKLFLTRLGFNSKMIVTGDITQIDLPQKELSGLVHATTILRNLEQVSVIEFEMSDVVRHPLVQSVLERYENDERKHNKLF
jgi:phosphate starvation-inducible PhoH-like protein